MIKTKLCHLWVLKKHLEHSYVSEWQIFKNQWKTPYPTSCTTQFFLQVQYSDCPWLLLEITHAGEAALEKANPLKLNGPILIRLFYLKLLFSFSSKTYEILIIILKRFFFSSQYNRKVHLKIIFRIYQCKYKSPFDI